MTPASNPTMSLGLAELAEMGFVPLIDRHYGKPGVRALRAIMRTLRAIYQHYDPQGHETQLVVFQSLPGSRHKIDGSPVRLVEIGDLRNWTTESVAIEVGEDNSLKIWLPFDNLILSELSNHAIVYSFENGNESFWAGGEQALIPKIFPGRSSIFAIPTFSVLQEALQYYRSNVVRVTQCEVLRMAWHDERRLFF